MIKQHDTVPQAIEALGILTTHHLTTEMAKKGERRLYKRTAVR
ncbi:protein of unknown function [Xenorhabdus poinarii G6]|uniref:Uncharacterized protein n=1 Tax=Xenorhabdus poinarii G6 TaxID=1354304 RepID=A0A068R0J4_9GAMM|nr:protein of unknown function [Xenorhabdus poinarii G6]